MIIDYTKWRKGRVVASWQYTDKETGTRKNAQTVIAVCPKCGKKGEKCIVGKDVFRYAHKAELTEVIPGFPLLRVTEHCEVKE